MVCIARRKKSISEREARPSIFTNAPSRRDEALLTQLITHLRSTSRKKSKLDIADKLSVTPEKVDSLLTHLREQGIYKPVLVQKPNGLVYQLSDWPGTREPCELSNDYFPDGRVRFGAIANTELCNSFHRDDALHAFYEICAREGVHVVLHCGDIIAGESKRATKEEIFIEGPENQAQYFAMNYPRVEGIDTYFITAKDCEGTFMSRHKMMIGKYLELMARHEGRDDLVYLGHMEQDVHMNVPVQNPSSDLPEYKQATVRMGHLTGKIPYARSYPSQKRVDSIQGGKKPHVELLGHLYSLETLFEREIWTVQVGGFKDQSPSMRSDRQGASVGGYIIELSVPRPGEEVFQEQDFALDAQSITFFNREYYQNGRRK